MIFGVRKADAPAAGGDGLYMRNFPKGETKVRFLEEPDEWILYYEHYNTDQKAFPCTGDTSSCPGCTSEIESVQRRSRKYGTFVYNPQWNDTVPYKIAMTLANRLTMRAERNNGTITNRDYVVIRSGEGLKTEYDVDQDEKYSLDISDLLKKAPKGSINEVLKEMFTEIWGDPEQYNEKPQKDPRPKAKVEKADDTPPWEEKSPSPAKEEQPEEEITEAQLRAMKRSELVAIWKKAEFDGFDEDWDTSEIVDEIIKRAS